MDIDIENALALLVVPTQDISSPKSRGRSLNDCVDLKVMPLGASITWGTDSTTGDGYRRALGQLILDGGNNVAFTGTRENGDFDDNAVEAYPGDTIDEVARKSRSSGSYDYLPNVILIHLGTNDCSLKIDLANAPTRMANLVRNLTSAIPETTVIVSNLIPNLDPETEQCSKKPRPFFSPNLGNPKSVSSVSKVLRYSNNFLFRIPSRLNQY